MTLEERFEKAWEKHRELSDELKTFNSYGHKDEWSQRFVDERSAVLEATAQLLNKNSEAGLVMFENWLLERKQHHYTLMEFTKAQYAVHYYREWMAGRGGKLSNLEGDIDFQYVEQIETKFKNFIKDGYWTWPGEENEQ